MAKERKRKQREAEPKAIWPGQKVLLGVCLATLNVLLLFHNLEAFEKPVAKLEAMDQGLEEHLVPTEVADSTLLPTTQPVRLRGKQPVTVAELVAQALTRNLSRLGERWREAVLARKRRGFWWFLVRKS